MIEEITKRIILELPDKDEIWDKKRIKELTKKKKQKIFEWIEKFNIDLDKLKGKTLEKRKENFIKECIKKIDNVIPKLLENEQIKKVYEINKKGQKKEKYIRSYDISSYERESKEVLQKIGKLIEVEKEKKKEIQKVLKNLEEIKKNFKDNILNFNKTYKELENTYNLIEKSIVEKGISMRKKTNSKSKSTKLSQKKIDIQLIEQKIKDVYMKLTQNKLKPIEIYKIREFLKHEVKYEDFDKAITNLLLNYKIDLSKDQPYYISDEQIQNSFYDKEEDIYYYYIQWREF